ncbi:oleosin G-like [Macadamia integrifolia]|uniref:oleosin G-like n=1 Tax=Macadamia integrifolia TaxID=60698 RepID=UPI001C4F282C|nr:oleosin G-like [Macadamia integrifolia]
MADLHSSPGQAQRPNARAATGGGGAVTGGPTTGSDGCTFLRKLRNHAPNSTQVMGLLTLVISGGMLLFLIGLILTAMVMGLMFFNPLIMLTSPIWVPAGFVLLIFVGGSLSICGSGVAIVAGLSWSCMYLRGRHPPGSDRLDYARRRLADTAYHVKDYAKEYGGYLHSRNKDAAPGA